MTLDEIRIKIDEIDTQIKELFADRMKCAKGVADVKNVTGGDVFVPEREKSIIEKRSENVSEDIKNGYVAFLKYLMSVSRQYQYSLLDGMKSEVLSNITTGLNEDQAHNKILISFLCDKNENNLNLYINTIALNNVKVSTIDATSNGDDLSCKITLEGSLDDEKIRTLLCQLAKEAKDFKLMGLE